MTDPASATTALCEDLLATVRLSSLHARRLYDPETSPKAWLDTFIQRLHALGWSQVNRQQTQQVYTPASGVWLDIFNGSTPPKQPPNTRFKTIVRHVIATHSDGSAPLPYNASDSNMATYLLVRLSLPEGHVPRLRVIQLRGTPDPEAPKTRLPIERTCWEADFEAERFEAQRSAVATEMKAYETDITDL